MNTDPSGLRFAPDEGLAEQGGGYGRTEDLTPDDGFDSQAYYSPQNEEVYPDPDPDPTPPAANGDPAADAAPPAASATPTPGHSAAPTSAQKAEPKPGVPGSNGTGSGIGDFPGDFVHDLLALCLTGATAQPGRLPPESPRFVPPPRTRRDREAHRSLRLPLRCGISGDTPRRS